jgi:hypothetical protein
VRCDAVDGGAAHADDPRNVATRVAKSEQPLDFFNKA